MRFEQGERKDHINQAESIIQSVPIPILSIISIMSIASKREKREDLCTRTSGREQLASASAAGEMRCPWTQNDVRDKKRLNQSVSE
jgi:hypothetical protein